MVRFHFVYTYQNHFYTLYNCECCAKLVETLAKAVRANQTCLKFAES